MKKALRKLKLLDDLAITLKMDKTEFVKRLSSIVTPSKAKMFSVPFESLISSNFEFIGEVNSEGFHFRRKRRLFDPTVKLTSIQGTYIQHGDDLKIVAEVIAYRNFLIFLLIILILFYLGPIVVMITVGGKVVLFAIPFIILHAFFMLVIPYLLIRGAVSRMKYDLEREFFYLTKD